MTRHVVQPPEYWPRAHVVALAMWADVIWLCDSFQYSRQSFQNRTRVRTPDGWQWLSVPLKGGQHGRPICDVQLEPGSDWQGRHRRSLHHNYARTPYFMQYDNNIAQTIDRQWDRLGELTVETTRWLLRAFEVDVVVKQTSQRVPVPMNLEELAPDLDGTVVCTPRVSDRFIAAGLPVEILSFEERPRVQNFDGFEPGMSALDVLFNYGVAGRSLIRGNATSAMP